MINFNKIISFTFLLLGGTFSSLCAGELNPEDLSVHDKIAFFEHRIAKTHEKAGGPLTDEQKAHQKAVLDKPREVVIKAEQWDGMTMDERLKFLNDHNPAIAYRDDQGRIFDKDGG